MAEFDEQGRPKPPTDTPVQNASTQNTSAQPPVTTAFAFNHPTIISLLYLSSCVLFVTGLIGLVLAYVWKGEPHEEWETSHYAYLIRTFWIGLIGSFVGVLLMIVLIGFLVLLAVAVIVVVRCVLSLVNAQKQQPMPNPDTWLI